MSVKKWIKNQAYKIMSQSPLPNRSFSEIVTGLINPPKEHESYTGSWDEETGELDKKRNLNKLYLFGNEDNNFTEYTGANGVNYNNYLISQSKNPDDVKVYEGKIIHDLEDFTFPDYAKPYIDNLARTGKAQTVGYEHSYGDNVAGHLGKLGINRNGNPSIIMSDLWDFSPKEYGKKWGGLKSKIQASMLDKIGTPFILKDDTSNEIQYAPSDSDNSKLTYEKAQIMLNAGIIPEIIVTASKNKNNFLSRSVKIGNANIEELKKFNRVYHKSGGTLNYLDFFK